jgi:hypothetical protein
MFSYLDYIQSVHLITLEQARNDVKPSNQNNKELLYGYVTTCSYIVFNSQFGDLDRLSFSYPLSTYSREIRHIIFIRLYIFTKRVGIVKFCVIGLCRQNFCDEIWIPIGTQVGVAVISPSSVEGIIHWDPTAEHAVFLRPGNKTFIEPK